VQTAAVFRCLHHRQFGLVLVDNFYEPSYESGKAVRWKIELAVD
jgi:putative SOS response-associated peptidase YedK